MEVKIPLVTGNTDYTKALTEFVEKHKTTTVKMTVGDEERTIGALQGMRVVDDSIVADIVPMPSFKRHLDDLLRGDPEPTISVSVRSFGKLEMIEKFQYIPKIVI